MTKKYPIFGLREMSWPKGDGYLYLEQLGKSEGKPLASFNLYKTTNEEFRAIIQDTLSEIIAHEKIDRYELKNFSPASELIFQEVAKVHGWSHVDHLRCR